MKKNFANPQKQNFNIFLCNLRKLPSEVCNDIFPSNLNHSHQSFSNQPESSFNEIENNNIFSSNFLYCSKRNAKLF